MEKKNSKDFLRESLKKSNSEDLELDYPKLFNAISETMQDFADQQNQELREQIERLQAEVKRLREGLQTAYNGLLWYYNEYPETQSNTDNEMHDEINQLLKTNRDE